MKYKTLKKRQIGQDTVNSVLASELHKNLEVKTKLSDWLKREIEGGMFNRNTDYVILYKPDSILKEELRKQNKSEPAFLNETELLKQETTLKSATSKGWVKDAILTLDTSKELAMMSKTIKGKESREYFISVEKVATNLIGTKKLHYEIEKLKTEELLLREDIIDKRVARVKVLQDLGVNFDATTLIDSGKCQQVITKDVSEALTSAYSDIRTNVRTYSVTYLLRQNNVNVRAPIFNDYLIEIGVAESYIFEEKRYKKFKNDINFYGHNKHASSVKINPMSMYYYEDRFSQLITLLKNEGYEL